jgi:hypothetical protein
MRAVLCAPLAEAPLKGAPHAEGETARVHFLQFAQQRDGFELWGVLEQWDEFAFPNIGERVSTGTPSARRIVRGLMGAPLNAPSRAFAKACHGGSSFLGMVFAFVHIEADLLIRDMGSRHGISHLHDDDTPS